jgi:hypothetical protein
MVVGGAVVTGTTGVEGSVAVGVVVAVGSVAVGSVDGRVLVAAGEVAGVVAIGGVEPVPWPDLIATVAAIATVPPASNTTAAATANHRGHRPVTLCSLAGMPLRSERSSASVSRFEKLATS